jgi:hypothetical protein
MMLVIMVLPYFEKNTGRHMGPPSFSFFNWGRRKSIVCEKVPRLRPLVLLVRVIVKVKALE